MNRKTVWALYKKEILDILRDKKTIFMMVIMPIFLYPVIVVAMLQIMQNVSNEMQQKTYKIAFEESITEQQELKNAIVEIMEEKEYHLQIIDTNMPEQYLQEKQIDAYLVQEEQDGQMIYTIKYVSTINDSVTAADMLKELLNNYREQLRKEGIEAAGLDVQVILYPIVVELDDQASGEETLGNIIGSMIPFLLITSILLGSMYPAIDVTAGEKERGTLETVLTLPISNYELITSKFFAVATISCISALLNLISMGFLGLYLYNTIGFLMNEITIQLVEFIPAIIIMIICVLVFALFVTALSLCVCLFAKSFKEAQNYITPLMLVIMLTGYIGFIPNVELTQTTAIVPVANICLLIKQIFTFQLSYELIVMVLVSNIVYSMVSMMVLGKIYNSETVLFGDGKGGIRLLERRANLKSGQLPTIADAVIVLAIVLLGTFYIGTYAQLKFGFIGVAVQQVIILLVPISFIIYLKYDLKKTLSIKIPKLSDMIGSIMVWAGTYLLAAMASKILAIIFPSSLEYLGEYNQYFLEQNTILLFIIVGICPAIAEEVLFRGFVFSAMKERWKPWTAILLSSILFGLYHMDIIKFFTTGMLGIAMAYSVYYSNSIITSMCIHFLNNTGSVCALVFPDSIGKVYQVLDTEEPALMVSFIIISMLLIIVGRYLLRKK